MPGTEQVADDGASRMNEKSEQPLNSNISKNSRNLLIVLASTAILVSILSAYSPILFNFFAGDDFVHLTWLAQAVHHPELIWRNFYSSWLDGTTTKFYRPLISIFMVVDYLFYGINGLGFHIDIHNLRKQCSFLSNVLHSR